MRTRTAVLPPLAGTSYSQFLDSKRQHGAEHGVELASHLGPELFGFQRHIVEWASRKGRCGVFADCGMGKTPMQLVWAQNIVEALNRKVLILTPLAVASQTVREAEKFNIEAVRSKAGELPGNASIVVTNYDRLHMYDPQDFCAVVCDESSAIKSFNGKLRAAVTGFLQNIPYRLLCTATAAPNDYIELGTASEALGELGYMDMLNRFFKNYQANSAMKGTYRERKSQWRFKGHAETPFWRWVSSWARALRKPSDMGFEDDSFNLTPLVEREHIVDTRTMAPGMLFSLPARNLQEEREERRRTIQERCEMAAELVAGTNRPAVIWCHLNDEGKLLEKLIPDGREVAGAHSDDQKEEAYEAFQNGSQRVLIIKPKIGAWGLNWQHCSHVVTFASHSYEQYYQAVRRCWRFGQRNPVTVDLVVTEGEKGIKENLRRKSDQADRMFSSLVAHMNDAIRIDRNSHYEKRTEVPAWL